MTLFDLYTLAKADRYVQDTRHYEVGEISVKTGLQKCNVNGRIIWLPPDQGGGFLEQNKKDLEHQKLARTCKLARNDGAVDLSKGEKNGASSYLKYMSKTWKAKPVICPFLNGVKIKFNNESYHHFFYTNGRPRSNKEIKRRVQFLPFIRDILERSGKPSDHYIKNKKESYSIVGRARINGDDKKLVVVISKKTGDHYYYLSVMNC